MFWLCRAPVRESASGLVIVAGLLLFALLPIFNS